MITENPLIPERSETVISLIIHTAAVPRLFRDVTSLILDTQPEEVSTVTVEELQARAQELRGALDAWHASNWGSALHPIIGAPPADGRCDTLVRYYAASMLCSRLVAAISWSNRQLVNEQEDEAQRMAQKLVSCWQREKSYSNLQGAMYMGQKVRWAEATIGTHDDWRTNEIEGFDATNSRPAVIERAKFERWSKAMGRRTS